jgi:hypothetical protein
LALTNPLKGFFSAKAARGFGRPVLAAAASMMLWMADVTTLLKVSVSVWSGFDGTGSLLATLNLPANAVGCPDFGDADLCPFTSAQVTFAGVARSVQFSGISAEFDDIRFHSGSRAIHLGDDADWICGPRLRSDSREAFRSFAASVTPRGSTTCVGFWTL